MVSTGADAVFRATGGIDDHMVALFAGKTGGIEKVNLLAGTELDVNDFHHFLRHRGFDIFFHE
jgi:hypothetical protein